MLKFRIILAHMVVIPFFCECDVDQAPDGNLYAKYGDTALCKRILNALTLRIRNVPVHFLVQLFFGCQTGEQFLAVANSDLSRISLCKYIIKNCHNKNL